MVDRHPDDASPAGRFARGPFAELLHAADDHGQRVLLASMERREVPAGQVVIAEGDFVDGVHVVEEGLLRAEVPDRHGLPFEVARYGPGDYFGEMSFLRGDRASATVRTLTATRLATVPHVVLGEVAERQPALIRQLAGLVTSRLSATNLRFRQLRPGRVVACVGDGDWARVALIQVLRAAAVHAGRPVVLIDTSGSTSWLFAEPLPALADSLAQPALLTAHDTFAARRGPAVGIMPGGTTDLALEATFHLISELQTRYPLIAVFAQAGAGAHAGLIDSLDGPFLFVEERAEPGRWQDAGGRSDAQVILLRMGTEGILPAQLPTRESPAKGSIVHAIPGGPQALQGTPPGGIEGNSPWREVNWCARHLLRKKVGLALGAGGSKGYAHMGVVERLRSINVPIDYIAGSSIGAPIAAAIAGGMGLDELKGKFDETFSGAMRLTIPVRSFLSNRSVRRRLTQIAAGRRIEDLEMPLAIVAVDLYDRTEVVLRSGPAAPAMVASMAIPGIFPPVRVGARMLVDGGLLNPVPNATVADMGADVVIGVKLTNPIGPQRPTTPRRRLAFRAPPIVDSITNAFEIMQWKITTEGAARSDITIEPVFSGPTGLREYTRGSEFVEAGRRAVDASRPAIAELLPWTGSLP